VNWIQAHEARDCGAACVATAALTYGIRLDVGKIATLAGVNLQGARLDRLRDAARAVGFSSSCGKLKAGQIGRIPLPAILHLVRPSGEHYVTLLKWSDRTSVIADPTIGILRCPTSELMREASGYILLLKPDDHFAEASKPYRGKNQLSLVLNSVRSGGSAFILASIAALFAVCASLAVPLAVSTLIDRVAAFRSTAGHLAGSNFAVDLFLLIGVVSGTFTFLRQMFVAILSVQIQEINLTRFLQKLAGLPLSFFDRCHPGDVIARINDAVSLRMAISGPILGAILDISYLIVASLLLFKMSLMLLVITIFAVALSYSIHIWILPRQLVYGRITRTRMTELMSSVLEAVVGIRLFKALVQERRAVDCMKQRHAEALSGLRRMTILSAWSTAAGLLISGITMAALIAVSQKLILAHSLSPGKLAYLIAVSSVMVGSSERLAGSAASVDDIAVSRERLMQTDRAEPERTTPQQSTEAYLCPKSIEFLSVSFGYGNEELVIADLNLSINCGETVGIGGESGSGKSTLAVLCNGLYQAQSGRVSILGRPIEEWNLPSLRKHVSIVFSDSNLVSGTIRENILLGNLERDENQIQAAAEMACADEFVRALPNGYSYRLGHVGFGLSNGQKQRIALARAVLANPEILILDEATSSLDVSMERRILDNLLLMRKGHTTLLISHRPATLAITDRSFEMIGGKLVPHTCPRTIVHSV
jgi:ATP-binding cassette subfamily B protein